MNNKRNNKFMIGFLLGSSVTTIATLIFHPRTGSYTRQILRKTYQALPEIVQDFSSTLQTHSQNITVSASKKWQRTYARLQVAISAGIEASRKEAQSDQQKQSKSYE